MTGNEKIYISMEDAVLVENKAYFFAKEWNALYAANLDSEKIEFISTMPEEDIVAGRLCAGITYHNGKLILIPMMAKKIWIYELKSGEWQGLERKDMADGNPHKEMFRAVEYKGNLFLIGSNYPAVIQLNLDSLRLAYWKEPYEFFKSVQNKADSYFRADFSLVGNQLFLASCRNPFVLRLNLDTFEFVWFEVGERSFCYSGIAWDGNYFWLSPRMGTPIVKWDGKDRMEYFPLPERFESNKNNFLGVQYEKGRLVFPGMMQNCTIVMDPEHPSDIEIREGRYTCYRCFGMDGKLSQSVDGLFQWRISGQNRFGQMYCEMPFVDLIEYFRMHMDESELWKLENSIWIETFSFTLFHYLLITGQKMESEKKESKIGEILWKTVRN